MTTGTSGTLDKEKLKIEPASSNNVKITGPAQSINLNYTLNFIKPLYGFCIVGGAYLNDVYFSQRVFGIGVRLKNSRNPFSIDFNYGIGLDDILIYINKLSMTEGSWALTSHGKEPDTSVTEESRDKMVFARVFQIGLYLDMAFSPYLNASIRHHKVRENIEADYYDSSLIFGMTHQFFESFYALVSVAWSVNSMDARSIRHFFSFGIGKNI